MKTSFIIAAFISITFFSCKNDKNVEDTADDQLETEMPMENALMKSMEVSNDSINKVKATGDFDYDFAKLMLSHHQMAVDMSQVVIAQGTDATVKNMAKAIVAVQQTEISELQFFIKNRKILKTNLQSSESTEVANEMKSMMDKMQDVKMSGEVDKDFVAMMIPHHESAVTMAKKQLLFGSDDGLKALAKNIIKNQNFEIESFKVWQSKL